MNSLASLQCIQPQLLKTELRRLSRVAQEMLSMDDRVTMLAVCCLSGR